MWLLLHLWLLLSFPKYLLVSISSSTSTYSSLSSFPLLWVGRFFKPWLSISWFVSICETKFWNSIGVPCKCWLSAWMFADLGLHIQHNYSLLPLSNKSLSLYRCVLNFVLPAVSLCVISPGKELHSQLPLLRILQLVYLSSEVRFVDRNLFLLDQSITVETRKVPCPSIWRRSSLVHDPWKWRGEKNRRSGCISLEVLEAAAGSCSYRHPGCCGPAFNAGTQHLWSFTLL